MPASNQSSEAETQREISQKKINNLILGWLFGPLMIAYELWKMPPPRAESSTFDRWALRVGLISASVLAVAFWFWATDNFLRHLNLGGGNPYGE